MRLAAALTLLAPFALAARGAAASDYRAEMLDGRTLEGSLELSSGRLLLRQSPAKATALELPKLRRLALTALGPATRPAPPRPGEVRVGTPVGQLHVRTDGGTVEVGGDSGEVEGSGESLPLYGWKQGGECELTARLLAVKGIGGGGREAGGLMIRHDDSAQCPFVAVAIGGEGPARVLFRREAFRMPETYPLAVGAGDWFRLVREEKRARVLTSTDGTAWREAWSMPMTSQQNSVAGAFVSARAGTATLSLSGLAYDDAPQLLSLWPGLMLVSGSFLNGNVDEVEGAVAHVGRNDYEFRIPRDSIAWFCSQRFTKLDLQRLERASGEAFLFQNDDVIEGRLIDYKGLKAHVDSLLFGVREFEPGAGGWTAGRLHPVTPVPARFVVYLNTEDILRCRGISVAGDHLQLDAPELPEPARRVELHRIREIRAAN